MFCCEPSPAELFTWDSVLLWPESSCRIQPYIPGIQSQHQSVASYCSAWEQIFSKIHFPSAVVLTLIMFGLATNGVLPTPTHTYSYLNCYWEVEKKKENKKVKLLIQEICISQ